MDAGELGGCSSGDLGGAQADQLPSMSVSISVRISCSCEFRVTHDFKSLSWELRSSFDLFHSWAVFCSGCKYAIGRVFQVFRAWVQRTTLPVD
jgi:hypothetical protein